MNTRAYEWYSALIKPSWAPPSWVFGPVWTFLYILIFVSYGYIFYQIALGKLPRSVALPFILNLIFNFAFTPIQFGLKNNFFAALDILLVLGTLAWALFRIYPHVRWVALANVPYLVWVCFASILQLTITWLNMHSS